MNRSIHEVIIIGAGPAGIACAIQLKRSGIKPVVFEKNRIGGLLYNANLVENYPGFPGGIPGEKLAGIFKKQFLSENIKVLEKTATDVKYLNDKFIVKTGSGTYHSKILVIAAGTNPKKLQGNILSARAAKRVFYEVYDIKHLENKSILIIGAGDLAFDFALNLGNKNKITIINRTGKINCIPLLYQRAKKLPKFEYFKNTVAGNIKITGNQLIVEISKNGKKSLIYTDYILTAIGREPPLKFLPAFLTGKLKKSGKLFIIGDAANKQYRQASIAAGDGVKIAMMINEKLKGMK